MKKEIILYDSDCEFCSRWIRIIKKKIKKKEDLFIPFKSDKGIQILNNLKIKNKDSVVFIVGEEYYLKSKAALNICSKLKFPYSLLKHISILPTSLLDCCYEFVAKRRHNFYQKKNML